MKTLDLQTLLHSGANLNAVTPNLSILQDKEAYLAFRKDWRANYAYLSWGIRLDRLEWKATLSESRKGARAPALRAQADAHHAKSPGGFPGLGLPHAYYQNAAGVYTHGSKAVANYLLWLRRESKRQAQLGYLRSKNVQNLTASH